MFMEIMMNQTRALVRPSVRRRRVRAKLVLDQMAATREKVPLTLMALKASNTYGNSAGGSSPRWYP